MKRLVVCTDGTWNSREQARADGAGLTNVARLADCVAGEDAAGNRQEVKYHDGVGIGPWWVRMVGGAFGVGLSRNVQACYRWICERYEPGDQLWFFGFSRGAFTARSLAGLIRNCGVLRRDQLGHVDAAYALYRDRGDDAHPNAARSVAFRAAHAHGDYVPIECIGVWDTVGALGVPTAGPIGWWTRRRHGFHDVALSSRVRHAFQALAIDERRAPFAPSLWEVPDAERAQHERVQQLEQAWFAGVHSNVGGGYVDRGLSDLALAWMLDRAQGCGLALRPGASTGLRANADGGLRDSMTTFYRLFGAHVRPVLQPRTDARGAPLHAYERVHASVFARRRNARLAYAPRNVAHVAEPSPAAMATATVTPPSPADARGPDARMASGA